MRPRHLLRRLRAMDREEVAARGAEVLRTVAERVRMRASTSRWDRRELASRLSPLTPALALARRGLMAGDWAAAHAALAAHFSARPPRFAIHASARDAVVSRVLAADPDAAKRSAAAAARIAAGRYDLLGYEGVRVARAGTIDWHFDPVSGRRAPEVFWADVPYLDPAIGDHKVIWELNRHQEWLMLGRASWLSEPGSPCEVPAPHGTFADVFAAQLSGWLEANPPGIGINWASSLELALRSLSWLWALEFFVSTARQGETAWTVDLLLGIDRQLQHVERHLSRYFSPNTHLLGEALALYVCGRALPELGHARRRAALGRRLLLDEALRQVLPDGVHAERSAHYHRYALDFYLLALTVARISGDTPAADRFRPVVSGMAEFMRDVCDDEGRYPQIGDDDGGELAPLAGRTCGDARASLGWAAVLLGRPALAVHPQPEAVTWLTALLGTADSAPQADAAGMPSRRSVAYPAAGYFISRHGRSHLVFDAGPHGFLNGGHAHADALALTLSVKGRPLLVDAGTGTYTMDARLRNRLRSSGAHNTITVDDRSQSVPGGPFSWGPAAGAAQGRIAHNPRFDYFEGTSRAYEGLVHERFVLALGADRWIVGDRISGAGHHEAALHWHLDPRWTAVHDGRGGVRLTHQAGDQAQLTVVGAPVDIVEADEATGLGWVSPVYGRVERSTTLRSRVIRRSSITLVTLIEAGRRPASIVARVAEVLSDRRGDTALAVAVARPDEMELALFGSGVPETRTVLLDPRRGLSVTTDARLLYARVDGQGRLRRLCLVDGSVARFEGASTATVLAAAAVRDLDLTIPNAGPAEVSSSRPTVDVNVHVDAGDSPPVQSRLPGMPIALRP